MQPTFVLVGFERMTFGAKRLEVAGMVGATETQRKAVVNLKLSGEQLLAQHTLVLKKVCNLKSF